MCTGLQLCHKLLYGRLRGNGLRLRQQGSGWVLGTISSQKEWHGLPRAVVESLSLQVFWNCGVVTLRDMGNECSGGGLGVDLVILVMSSNLNNCPILSNYQYYK